MFNLQVVAFVGVLGVVGVGVDYHGQAQQAGVSLAEFGFAGYSDSITRRLDAAEADRAAAAQVAERDERRKAGARIYLPDAPEGWVQRAWADGDNSRIAKPGRELTDAEQSMIDDNPILAKMMGNTADEAAKRRNAESWVYERGDEIVAIRAMFRPAPTGTGMVGNTATMLRNGGGVHRSLDGWAMIKGVAFGEHIPMAGADTRPYRVFKGFMGPMDEVTLEVRAVVASDEAVRDVLVQIDYDGLNSILSVPMAQVGAQAAPVPQAQQAELAEAILHGQAEASNDLYDAARDDMKSDRTPGLGMLGDVIDKMTGNAGLRPAGDSAEKSQAAAAPKAAAKPSTFTQSASEPSRFQTGGSVVAVCTTEGAFKRCRIEGG